MQEQETVGQRFSQLISHLGISKNAFAASLEKTATVIQHIVDERNKPGFDLLCKVFEIYPNVSKDWMLQGQGTMLTGAAPPARNAPAAATAPAASVAASKKEALVSSTLPAEKPAAATEPAAAPPRAERATAREASPDSSETNTSTAPAAITGSIAPVLPTTSAAPVVPVATTATVQESLQAALYAQQLAHQLTLAEMRNQHLQEQQRLMQQMLDMMQRQLSK